MGLLKQYVNSDDVIILITACCCRTTFIYLFIKIRQPDKNIHTVNAVKQAENRLVEWPATKVFVFTHQGMRVPQENFAGG